MQFIPLNNHDECILLKDKQGESILFFCHILLCTVLCVTYVAHSPSIPSECPETILISNYNDHISNFLKISIAGIILVMRYEIIYQK